MRSSIFITLIATALFGGGYLYYVAGSICPAPLSYRLGTLDPRFSLSEGEAKLAIAEAESVWEDATGRNLFTYQPKGDLVVNFIFDDRQKFSNDENVLKGKLDTTQNVSDSMRTTYAALVNTYNTIRLDYTKKAEDYTKKLDAYNQKVEQYNKQGGAPSEIFALLAQQKRQLASEQAVLNAQSAKLNALVSEINSVGEKANTVINTYNTGVGDFNKTFGPKREFTQGDYTDKSIHIYTFKNKEELVLVLVHELGHALSLEHVANPLSIMHYILGGQSKKIQLTTEDIAEFDRVCGQKSILEKLKMILSNYNTKI